MRGLRADKGFACCVAKERCPAAGEEDATLAAMGAVAAAAAAAAADATVAVAAAVAGAAGRGDENVA